MDTEHLGLSPEQQFQIDDIFLDTTLLALTQKTKYWDRAGLTYWGDLADELEAIHARAYNHAHEAVGAREEIDPMVTGIIGKLAFIDSLALPSSEELTRKDKVARALGDYASRRRLFKNLPHTDG
jgi:hypothetical protein